MSIWNKVSSQACTRFQEMDVLDNFFFQICAIIERKNIRDKFCFIRVEHIMKEGERSIWD
jgi:hypothetical protein